MDSRTQSLLTAFQRTRKLSTDLTEPLQPEDQVIQSMPDASPIKWHLAHATWFFETFILKPEAADYREFAPQYAYLFNSYYNHVGPQYLRPQRGLISRPGVAEVAEYRQYVDDHLIRFVESGAATDAALALLELGVHHEQQHQELMLTDLKHAFSFNPLHPALVTAADTPASAPTLTWHSFPGGIHSIGHRTEGFHFDNEAPAHEVLLQPFALASRLVSNEEYEHFVADGGYENPLLWLSDGWAWRQQQGLGHPLYWRPGDGGWHQYSLAGLQPLAPAEPACHLNYYEADAYARWCGKRLPTEFEWEVAARQQADAREQTALDLTRLHPAPATAQGQGLQQLFGHCWQWTQSAYHGYPGFQPAPGAVGEYNGKFMCNQLVLRGSSCATPPGHARLTYRNFFPAHAQWQFTGIRLADYV